MQQVPTQGIANWVEKWSFVSLGKDCVEEANHMHYKMEINYHPPPPTPISKFDVFNVNWRNLLLNSLIRLCWKLL